MASDDEQRPEPAAPSAVSRARRVAGLGRTGGVAAPPPRPRPPARVAAETAPTDRAAAGGSAPSDAGTAEPPRSRSGRNLPVAIGVGVGLGAVIAASLFAYRPSFAVIVGAAVLYGIYELARALGSAGIRPALTPLLVGSAASLVAAWQRGPSGLVVGVLITLTGVVVWRIADGALGYTRDVTASAFILLYVPALAGFAILLAHPGDGAARVLAFVATVVCSDTGGLAAGVFFGRHPLAPIVSKAKTWEGFAGSALACAAAGILFMTLTFHEAWWKGLLFGLAIVVTATLGDLGESMIKRDLEIKDMGSLLPGHGGIMDRLDSLLPCAAVAYLLLSAFAPV
ncbi:MAG: phosphatidate cytidylyltransferase [Jatrophihabitans sp.]|uniref:phosphatidate cytidylyltransferase n=1 Tax=Jatrophihabitans sp. TaxID=1932789 RepID=UPI003912E0CE